MSDRKKPYTNNEVFDIIINTLKEKDTFPKNIDYALSAGRRDCKEIRTYEFNIRNSLNFGGSEGIYLDIWLEYYEKDETKKIELGTIKTLETTREAMRYMGTLLADFVYELSDFTNKNLDDFTWQGFDVDVYDENGAKNSWYTCSTLERALKRKDELLSKGYRKVAIIDNSIRKEAAVYEN